MGEDVKIAKRFQRVFRIQIVLTIVFLCLSIPVYLLIDLYAGLTVSVLIAVYFVVCLLLYLKSKADLREELADYGLRQSRLMRQLLEYNEVACALLDRNGRILWMNEEFS